ncbi:sulfurtransferase TusA family protein [Candidatus Saccharibacteria bacterium]|nr:sulfurtransferase TusA family protein [Candidatus Saccharibacteria bacterium]
MTETKLDFKGMSCPMPIMKTAMAFKKAQSGDVFEVVSDDPGFEPDITAWCGETGNTLESLTKEGKDITAVIKKK